MKKIYQKPNTTSLILTTRVSMLNASANGLEGFGGKGGDGEGLEADSRSSFWEDED